MKKPLAFLIALSALALSGYVAGVYILAAIVAHFPAVGPFVFVDTHGNSAFTLRAAMLQPAAFMAAMAFSLAFDAACVGLDQSSFKRLLQCNTLSSRVDLFYTIIRVTGVANVLTFIFSFGTMIWLVNQIHRVLHIGILSHVHSFVLQFVAVYLINTFIGYWAHRLMHTRFLWEIHKVHHAAEEMNVVTAFRNHPIEQLIMSILNAFPVALLGASSPVIIVYTMGNLVYGSLAHSEIRLKSTLWNLIWITPAAHRIHHSNRIEHFDRNFGVLTLWDYLFGTYVVPSNEKLNYGVDDGETFNRSRYVLEVFDNVRRWLRPIWNRRGCQTVPASSLQPSDERKDETAIQPRVSNG
jgi:sterol desaturase/sphingolipid hydroxylase (fatty acid hydroxylase superfamily)